MQLLHRFFDTGKKQEKVVPYEPGDLPEQQGPRTAALEDSHAKTPAFFYGYAIVPNRLEYFISRLLPRRVLDLSETPAPAISSGRSRWLKRAFGARH